MVPAIDILIKDIILTGEHFTPQQELLQDNHYDIPSSAAQPEEESVDENSPGLPPLVSPITQILVHL